MSEMIKQFRNEGTAGVNSIETAEKRIIRHYIIVNPDK
jgi:hypothetical protein